MNTLHAVLRIDPHSAQLLRFDDDHVNASKAKEHTHHTAQHGSAVRTEHEFFGHVSDSLTGVEEILVVGGCNAAENFRHYCQKHRPQLIAHILDVLVVDHPTEAQLVALARRYFIAHDRMAGIPTPS